ncbi:MAG: 30S ribosomal protein S20 [bacterium]
MPKQESAEKRNRQNKKRRAYNNSWKTRFRSQRNKLFNAIEEGADEDEVRALGQEVISILDKLESKGVFHQNKSARLKSRIQKRINKNVGEE